MVSLRGPWDFDFGGGESGGGGAGGEYPEFELEEEEIDGNCRLISLDGAIHRICNDDDNDEYEEKEKERTNQKDYIDTDNVWRPNLDYDDEDGESQTIQFPRGVFFQWVKEGDHTAQGMIPCAHEGKMCLGKPGLNRWGSFSLNCAPRKFGKDPPWYAERLSEWWDSFGAPLVQSQMTYDVKVHSSVTTSGQGYFVYQAPPQAPWRYPGNPEYGIYGFEHADYWSIKWNHVPFLLGVGSTRGSRIKIMRFPEPRFPNTKQPLVVNKKECCDRSLALVEEIHEALAVNQMIENISIPKKLFIPGGSGDIEIANYADYLGTIIRIQAQSGIFPFSIEKKDINLARTGNQSQTYYLPTATEAVKAILENTIDNETKNDAILNLSVRIGIMVSKVIAKTTFIEKTVQAITDFLGYPRREKVARERIEVDPTLGARKQVGFRGFGPAPRNTNRKIEKQIEIIRKKLEEGDKSLEEALADFLQPDDVAIRYEEFDDQSDIPDLIELIEKR